MVERSEPGDRHDPPATYDVLDDVPAQAAVVDASGAIQAVNTEWRRFALENGAADPNATVGWSYRPWVDDSDPDTAHAAAGVLSVINGDSDEFSFTYPCHSPTTERWFRFLVVPASPTTPPRAVLTLHLPLGPGVAERLHGLRREMLDGPPVVVCAWCHGRSRKVEGGWTYSAPDEVLVGPVSHGICPDCLEAVEQGE